MDLNSIHFIEHGACEALTAALFQLQEQQPATRLLTYREQETVWLAADMHSHIYWLESGRIEITITDANGKRVLLRLVQSGEMFGYLCFCSHRFEPHGTEARFTAPGMLRRTSYQRFRRLLQTSPAAAAELAASLCQRVSQADRRIELLLVRDAKKRLGKLLLQLAAEKIGDLSSAERAALYLSHAELAGLASLTRSHVTTMMTRLRDEGCVSYGRSTVVELHLRKLEMCVEREEVCQ